MLEVALSRTIIEIPIDRLSFEIMMLISGTFPEICIIEDKAH